MFARFRMYSALAVCLSIFLVGCSSTTYTVPIPKPPPSEKQEEPYVTKTRTTIKAQMLQQFPELYEDNNKVFVSLYTKKIEDQTGGGFPPNSSMSMTSLRRITPDKSGIDVYANWISNCKSEVGSNHSVLLVEPFIATFDDRVKVVVDGTVPAADRDSILAEIEYGNIDITDTFSLGLNVYDCKRGFKSIHEETWRFSLMSRSRDSSFLFFGKALNIYHRQTQSGRLGYQEALEAGAEIMYANFMLDLMGVDEDTRREILERNQLEDEIIVTAKRISPLRRLLNAPINWINRVF